ncbi:MAG: trimethoprim-resistant dihydrofolate reductase DfrA1, partial [Gammaproteobacteria bacterium]|nr:trimethoprim-resistant dihydrofolate reductase DfrA1 [Gammaproteobacteria bacterium]
GEIYRQAFDLNIADVLHITTIQTEVEGDVYFPQIPENDFSIVDEKRYLSNIDYLYERYERVSD